MGVFFDFLDVATVFFSSLLCSTIPFVPFAVREAVPVSALEANFLPFLAGGDVASLSKLSPVLFFDFLTGLVVATSASTSGDVLVAMTSLVPFFDFLVAGAELVAPSVPKTSNQLAESLCRNATYFCVSFQPF